MRTPGIDDRERMLTLSALASVALIIGLLTDPAIGSAVGLGFLLTALFLPMPGAWLVAGWKAVTHRVFRVVTSLMLVLVHLLVVTPIGILRRLGRKPVDPHSTFVPADEPADGPEPASWDRPG